MRNIPKGILRIFYAKKQNERKVESNWKRSARLALMSMDLLD
jgi:hypothetical protein